MAAETVALLSSPAYWLIIVAYCLAVFLLTEWSPSRIRAYRQRKHDKLVDAAVSDFQREYFETQGHWIVSVDSRLPRAEQLKQTIAELEEHGQFSDVRYYKEELRSLRGA